MSVAFSIFAVLVTVWLYATRRPRPVPWGPWIVVVEPSVFRVAETYVCGPYQTRADALREARWQITTNPHAAATLYDSGAVLTCAGRQLWPAP